MGMATALVKSGNLNGMRYVFTEKYATRSMMALGKQAESFVEKALYGSLGNSEQKDTTHNG